MNMRAVLTSAGLILVVLAGAACGGGAEDRTRRTALTRCSPLVEHSPRWCADSCPSFGPRRPPAAEISIGSGVMNDDYWRCQTLTLNLSPGFPTRGFVIL